MITKDQAAYLRSKISEQDELVCQLQTQISHLQEKLVLEESNYEDNAGLRLARGLRPGETG